MFLFGSYFACPHLLSLAQALSLLITHVEIDSRTLANLFVVRPRKVKQSKFSQRLRRLDIVKVSKPMLASTKTDSDTVRGRSEALDKFVQETGVIVLRMFASSHQRFRIGLTF